MRLHALKYFLVRADILGSMMNCWWNSVSQVNVAYLLGVVVLYWVVGVVYRRANSDKATLVESVLVGFVSMISIVGDIEVSR